jgi:hypothetical protein
MKIYANTGDIRNTGLYSAANTVAAYANGTLVLAAANLNFNNTATVNVAATANGNVQTNIAFTANGTALGIPAVNANVALAYAQANSQATYANGTLVVANIANINFNNTATVNVAIAANTGFGGQQTNAAFNANGTALGIPAINTALGTMNTNLGVVQVYANNAANTVATYANGTLSMANANINFNNSATVNVATAPNANQFYCNVSFSVNASAIGGNYQVDTSQYGATLLGNATLNYVNTTSINAAAATNGSAQVNVAWTINTSMNLVSLNVSGNISNTGNLLVSQNTTTGNLSVTSLANIGNANIVSLISPNTTTYANGTIVVASANLNFNNTTTINIGATANGTQSNLTFTANILQIAANVAPLVTPGWYGFYGGV